MLELFYLEIFCTEVFYRDVYFSLLMMHYATVIRDVYFSLLMMHFSTVIQCYLWIRKAFYKRSVGLFFPRRRGRPGRWLEILYSRCHSLKRRLYGFVLGQQCMLLAWSALILHFFIHGNFEQSVIAQVCRGRIERGQHWLHGRD
jgi:hypothetical protein